MFSLTKKKPDAGNLKSLAQLVAIYNDGIRMAQSALPYRKEAELHLNERTGGVDVTIPSTGKKLACGLHPDTAYTVARLLGDCDTYRKHRLTNRITFSWYEPTHTRSVTLSLSK